MPLPTWFSGFTLLAGPKHSISVPFSAGSAVPLSVDVKEVAPFVSNPVPGVALKAIFGPQIGCEFDRCSKIHSLPLFTFQVVTPFMFPETVQLKVKVLPGQVRGTINCPATSPVSKQLLHTLH